MDKQLLISWPGQQITTPLDKPVLRLGRATANDIRIDHPVVADEQATLEWRDDGYYVVAGAGPAGLYCEGQRVTERRLENGDIMRISDGNQNVVMLMYFDASAPPPAAAEHVRLDYEISIGRDARNDLMVDDPLVAAFHAVITPVAGGHVVRDLQSSAGTYVDGQRITQTQLELGDIIQVGATKLHYDGAELARADLRRQGVRVEGTNLRKQVKTAGATRADAELKVLLDDVSIVAYPREFVAIVGGSGTGKSTLLDALNGFRPSEGRVLVNGDDLYAHFDAYRQGIGYVPQDDIIHRELTVGEALHYVARLRLPPDTPPAEIERRIDQVLEQVAMTERKTVLVRQLSGGQRKRVSIAVELIADPGVIFLDEPTSGLDPGLDKKMMFTLKQLADAGKTVILVTHATGNIVACDLVAFMAAGGRLAFYGTPQEALDFFGVPDFAEIYNLVALEADAWCAAFQTAPDYDKYIRDRLGQWDDGAARRREPPSPHRLRDALRQTWQTFRRQTPILIHRGLTLLRRDRRNLLFLVLQAPLIGMLMFFVLDANLFANLRMEIQDDATYRQALSYLSDMQKVLFLLACIATWFGLINAAREIVKELPIYHRERLVNLSILAYVAAKLVILLGLSVMQAMLLGILVHLRVGFPAGGVLLPSLVEVLITLALIIFSSACLGLLLSAVLGREDRLTSILPVFLIPQIVFAGIVFRFEEYTVPWFISLFTFSRWGVEALGASVHVQRLWDTIALDRGATNLAFPFSPTPDYLLRSWLVLLGYGVIAVGLTVVALRRRDIH